MTAAAKSMAEPRIESLEVHGGRLLLLADHMLPIVHFTLAWRHGALTDSPGGTGALALLLPMLLRGTKRRGRQAFHASLESLGSSLDTSVGFELAMVRGTCLSAHLQATFALLAEALAEPALDAEALSSLQQELAESLVNERDDDDSLAEVFLRRQFYRGTPLSQPAIGSRAQLGALSRDHLLAARQNLCLPWGVCALAGDVTAKTAERASAQVFASLSKRAPEAPNAPALPEAGVRPPPSRPAAPSLLLVDRAERTQAQIRMALPGVHMRHPDSHAFWLGCVAFGGTFTSPLTREVRDRRGWSYVAHADFRRRGVFASPVVLRTAPANADAAACLRLQLSLLADWTAGHSEQADLVQARHYLCGRAPFWSATAFDVLGPALLLALLDLPFDSLWGEQQRLAALPTDGVPAVIARHLEGTIPDIVVVGSAAALEGPLVAELGRAQVAVVPYTDGL